MPSDTTKATAELDNDYVAQLLASEARDSSLKYSTQGMGAYLPKRPTGAAPKANTRFLRNIIKETDSHNASLKRKEEREARERMRQLRGQTSSSAHVDRAHDRHRLHHQPDEVRSGRDKRESRDERHRSHRKRHRSTSASPNRDQSRRHRRTHESRGVNENYDRSSRKEQRQRSISRSRSPRHERSDTRDRHRRHRKRSRSLSRSRSISPDRHRSQRDRLSSRDKGNSGRTSDHNTRGNRSTRRHKHTREGDISTSHTPTSQQKESGYGSDPLEELVGPLPPKHDGFHVSEPIRSRGRGAYRSNPSNIDAHFACDYDPTLDVQMEDDDLNESNKPSRRPVAGLMTVDDDWELALEALRDRNRWRQKGEERLREAGFNDAVVDRWKHSSKVPGDGDEGRLEDVKWSKKGESREWDRGKFLDDDGHIDVKASW